jgi:type II secretion system protein G
LVPSLIGAAALLKLAATVTDWTALSKPDHVDFTEALKKNPPKIDLFMKNSDGGKFFKDLAAKHPEIMRQAGARAMTALHLSKVRGALSTYKQINGSYPTNDQGLGVLLSTATDPPVATSAALSRIEMMDGWGSDHIYRNPGAKHPDGYDLFSAGPDRLPDTDDDYWGD